LKFCAAKKSTAVYPDLAAGKQGFGCKALALFNSDDKLGAGGFSNEN
jgi:hypothetical protein